MIEAIKLYYPNGEHYKDLVAQKDGILKIFFGEKGEVVILCEDNILELRGFLAIAQKAYSKKAEE